MARIADRLNTSWHKAALVIYLAVVLAHWVEHVLQAVEVFVLGWPRPEARGALGLVFPWLVTSESLHYWYALFMLAGLIALRPAFVGPARAWWNAALWIQVWHHFEHLLLLAQVLAGTNLFGSTVPISLLQLVVPRVELHLVYNALVFVPMVVAMQRHASPPAGAPLAPCACDRRAARLARPLAA